MAKGTSTETHQGESAGFAEVGQASRLLWFDRMRDACATLTESSQYHAGVDSTEAERIAHDVIQFGRPPVIWNNIEIARWIWILIIDGRRHPLPI
jgi:hypothetical protein